MYLQVIGSASNRNMSNEPLALSGHDFGVHFNLLIVLHFLLW
jgi:hypothetical protein